MIKIIFLEEDEIEIVVSNEVYSALEQRAKVRGLSVESFLSAELLRAHLADR